MKLHEYIQSNIKQVIELSKVGLMPIHIIRHFEIYKDFKEREGTANNRCAEMAAEYGYADRSSIRIIVKKMEENMAV